MRRVLGSTTATLDPPDNGTAPAAAPPPEPARRERLQTEFEFELPRGYVDADGVVHKRGTMRLATARDELLPLLDDRVKRNPAYLTVVLLSRVVTRLGTVEGDRVDAFVIEDLFAADLAFLQDLYRRINTEGHTEAAVECPHCGESLVVDLAGGRLGGS
ncbi:MAG TPA: hypothetical protein VGR90_11365 [Acidimicrobiales bacterium]|nr:hypothetical protein [Acidimicrobiales bacterium]